jgi:hypothetical protein
VTVYISRPCEVEAVQWTGDNVAELTSFGATIVTRATSDELFLRAGVNGDQEFVPVPVGTWIVRNHDGDTDPHYWPVDDTYFRRKYEPYEPKEST